MLGPRVSVYPGTVTPEYSADMIKDMNKLVEPGRLNEVFEMIRDAKEKAGRIKLIEKKEE